MRLVKKRIVDLNERIDYLLFSSKNAKEEMSKLHSMIKEGDWNQKNDSGLLDGQIGNSMAYYSQENSFLEPHVDTNDDSILVFNVKNCFMLVNQKDIREDQDPLQELRSHDFR